MNKQLLIIAHHPSANTLRMAQALLEGARQAEVEGVACSLHQALQCSAEQVQQADALILFTPENLGYISGGMKDFFDRVYYPLLEIKQGLPMAAVVRAGHDGTGSVRALQTICTGLKWRWVQAPVVCKGEWQEDFLRQCEELGAAMAYALDSGII
ncbi:MAG: NAD(P)H-dependent oxidoreductase [Oceanospirillaceae bacterium]|nr:NAD(P)H-dependent oxidoreductase [Oceanospirillaceae bacterium]